LGYYSLINAPILPQVGGVGKKLLR